MPIAAIIILMLIFVALPALAETASPFKGGLRHTRVSPETNRGEVFARPQKDAQNAETPYEDDEIASRVWRKYKAIIDGTEQNQAALAEQKQAGLEGKPPLPETGNQQAARPKAGFAGIIDNYHSSQERRGQMRTLRIKPQETGHLEVNTPAADNE